MWEKTVNKKPEITSVCCTLYICNKISIRKPLVDISHIKLFWFSIQCFLQAKYKSNWSFSCKPPHLAFSFLPPVIFEIFTAAFPSRIFVFLPFHWPTKSDYSSVPFPMILKSSNDTKFECFFFLQCCKTYNKKTFIWNKWYFKTDKSSADCCKQKVNIYR